MLTAASVIRVLLSAGADRNRLDRDGNSAYELARRGSHSGVMQLLSGSNLMNNDDRGNKDRQVVPVWARQASRERLSD
eukprot:767137-Hanusia_phi.AAC.21